VPVGHQNYGGVAVDPGRDLIYVTNSVDDTVLVIDGTTCDAADTTGCAATPPAVPAGANPAIAAVNPLDGTVYVTDNGGGTASFFRFVTPDQPTGVTRPDPATASS
jgi:DNA-binding beta-propeller fold protein YncE